MVKGLSHIAIRTRDLDESLRFYREVLGLEEAFRLRDEDGRTRIVYLWIAPGQFIELFPDGKTGCSISAWKPATWRRRMSA